MFEKEKDYLEELLYNITKQTAIDDNIKNIYHYAPLKSIVSIAASNELWFGNIDYFMDKSERRYIITVIKELLNEIDLQPDFLATVKYMINNHTLDIKNTNGYYVLSTSLNGDSMSLWGYYTKDENLVGCSIGFNKDKLIASLDAKLTKTGLSIFNCGKIIYDKQRQKEILKTILLEFDAMWVEGDKELSLFLFQNLYDLLELVSLFFKYEGFSGEEEFRVVLSSDNSKLQELYDSGVLNFRHDKHGLKPFVKVCFEKDSVNELILSPTLYNNRFHPYKDMLTLLGYKNVNIQNSKMNVK